MEYLHRSRYQSINVWIFDFALKVRIAVETCTAQNIRKLSRGCDTIFPQGWAGIESSRECGTSPFGVENGCRHSMASESHCTGRNSTTPTVIVCVVCLPRYGSINVVLICCIYPASVLHFSTFLRTNTPPVSAIYTKRSNGVCQQTEWDRYCASRVCEAANTLCGPEFLPRRALLFPPLQTSFQTTTTILDGL